jgi:AcrR family transcriptional regulator
MTSDTRQRILDVASELFAEQGYDATSLREIADRMGFTKAALYYHFQSKDDILKALVQPAFELVGELVARLELATGAEDWADALTDVIAWFYDNNLVFFRILERNRHSVELLSEFLATQEHLQMHQRVEAAAHAAASSLQEEIRMIAALGAVTGFDDWAPTILTTSPPDVLRDELTAAVRDILRLPARRRAKTMAAQR